MDLGLEGRVAVVTASSRGLGRAIAARLAAEGAQLVMCARNRGPLEEAADQICQETGAEVISVPADLASARDVERLVRAAVEQMGGLDVLVTNVGGPPTGSLLDLEDDAWQAAAQQVLMPAVRLIRLAVPEMRARGGGRIVNVTSVAVKRPIPGLLLSNAYRAAVVALAKTLARELAPDQILINNVCPGRIATARLAALDEERARETASTLAEVRSAAQRAIPLGRYGQPQELAALVAFLASGQASYITGETILCDGGLAL